MTVEQLIKQLVKYPMDTEVTILDSETGIELLFEDIIFVDDHTGRSLSLRI